MRQVSELVSAMELAEHYLAQAIDCTNEGSSEESLLAEARDRVWEALANTRSDHPAFPALLDALAKGREPATDDGGER